MTQPSILSQCLSLTKTLKSTYGPLSSDKLIIRRSHPNAPPKVHVTNDGATLIRLLMTNRRNANEAHLILADVAESQERATGDGTTSVVLFATFMLHEMMALHDTMQRDLSKGRIIERMNHLLRILLREGIIKREHRVFEGLGDAESEERRNGIGGVEEPTQTTGESSHDEGKDSKTSHNLVRQWIRTTLQSKILRNDAEWIADHLVIPIVRHFRRNHNTASPHSRKFKKSNIHFLPIAAQGTLRDSTWIQGIIFRRGLTYAGHEQQQKLITSPKIILTSDEIEWKHMKENVKLNFDPTTYEEMLQFEWEQCQQKMEKIVRTGANVIISSKSIGDIATQYFARNEIVNIGMVETTLLEQLSRNLKVPIVTSLLALNGEDVTEEDDVDDSSQVASVEESHTSEFIGTCSLYKEFELRGEWYCMLDGIAEAEDITLTLHAPSQEILQESLRCFDDIFGVTECLLNNSSYTFGGGFLETHLSTLLSIWEDELSRHNLNISKEATPQSRATSLLPKEFLSTDAPTAHLDALCMQALSKALIRIVETLCENAHHPTRDTLSSLKHIHRNNILRFGSKLSNCEKVEDDSTQLTFAGISPFPPAIQDMRHVIEPSVVKSGYLIRGMQASTSLFASCAKIEQAHTSLREVPTTRAERAQKRFEDYRAQVKASKNL